MAGTLMSASSLTARRHVSTSFLSEVLCRGFRAVFALAEVAWTAL